MNKKALVLNIIAITLLLLLLTILTGTPKASWDWNRNSEINWD